MCNCFLGSKAFDIINHKKLLQNVDTIGNNGMAYNLLSSYLKTWESEYYSAVQ